MTSSQVSQFVVNNCITVQAAAAVNGYSQKYVRRLLGAGKLAGFKLGQVWLIEMESFEVFLANAESSKDHHFGPQ